MLYSICKVEYATPDRVSNHRTVIFPGLVSPYNPALKRWFYLIHPEWIVRDTKVVCAEIGPPKTRTSFKEFYERWYTCEECSLARRARKHVVYRGPLDAKLLFIGEAPGEQEDKKGIPFIGRSGELLDAIVEACGMKEDDYAVTNPVLCRPVTDEGKNGKPSDEEMAACARRLAEFLYIVNPMAVVLLGDYARRAWYGSKVPWFKTQIVKGGLPVVGVAYHPSYLLRQGAPEKKTKDYKRQVAYIKGIWAKVKGKRKRPTFKWDEQFHPLIESACARSKWKNE